MPNDFEILRPLITKITHPIDLGGYADELKGKIFTVHVNAPGAAELMVRARTSETWDNQRKAVAILYGWTEEQVKQLSDTLMVWLYSEGASAYWAYEADLKKKSPQDSTPISVPSATLTP